MDVSIDAVRSLDEASADGESAPCAHDALADLREALAGLDRHLDRGPLPARREAVVRLSLFELLGPPEQGAAVRRPVRFDLELDQLRPRHGRRVLRVEQARGLVPQQDHPHGVSEAGHGEDAARHDVARGQEHRAARAARSSRHAGPAPERGSRVPPPPGAPGPARRPRSTGAAARADLPPRPAPDRPIARSGPRRAMRPAGARRRDRSRGHWTRTRIRRRRSWRGPRPGSRRRARRLRRPRRRDVVALAPPRAHGLPPSSGVCWIRGPAALSDRGPSGPARAPVARRPGAGARSAPRRQCDRRDIADRGRHFSTALTGGDRTATTLTQAEPDEHRPGGDHRVLSRHPPAGGGLGPISIAEDPHPPPWSRGYRRGHFQPRVSAARSRPAPMRKGV